MSRPPRILFIDDDLGTNPQQRRDFSRARRLRIVEPAEANDLGASQDESGILADAYFHSGLDGAGVPSLDAVKQAVGEHWRQDGRGGDWRWALVCVDMSFTANGRTTNFGAEIVCALRTDQHLHNVPLALISGMKAAEVENALHKAADSTNFKNDVGPPPPRIAKNGDPKPLSSFAKLLFRSALIEDGSLRKVDGLGNVHVIEAVQGHSSTVGRSLVLLKALQFAREELALGAQFGRARSLFYYVSDDNDEGKCFNIYLQTMWCVAYEYFTELKLPRRGGHASDSTPNIIWTSIHSDSNSGQSYFEVNGAGERDLQRLADLRKKGAPAHVVIASTTAAQLTQLSRTLVGERGIDLGHWPSIMDRQEDLVTYANSLNPGFENLNCQVTLHEEVEEYISRTVWNGGFRELKETCERAFEKTILRGGETVYIQDFKLARNIDVDQDRSLNSVSFTELIEILGSVRFREQSHHEIWELDEAWDKLRKALAPILVSMFETGAKHEDAKKNGKLNAAGLARFLKVPGVSDPGANQTHKIADLATRLADEFGLKSDLIDQLKALRPERRHRSSEGGRG